MSNMRPAVAPAKSAPTGAGDSAHVAAALQSLTLSLQLLDLAGLDTAAVHADTARNLVMASLECKPHLADSEKTGCSK